jgi:hypothetical protein
MELPQEAIAHYPIEPLVVASQLHRFNSAVMRGEP